MIITTTSDAEYQCTLEALRVINHLRHRTYAVRPDTANTQWVRTVWPSEQFL